MKGDGGTSDICVNKYCISSCLSVALCLLYMCDEQVGELDLNVFLHSYYFKYNIPLGEIKSPL